MRGPAFALVAAFVGAAGFGAIEWAGRARGVLTALSWSVWVDLAAYALAATLLASLYRAAWQRSRGRRISAAVAYVALFPFVTALLAGVAELTARGGWAFPGEIRRAFVANPLNLLATFTVELGWLALPLAAVAVATLVFAARRPRP